jgi:trans-aconitate 2-methyltransferase
VLQALPEDHRDQFVSEYQELLSKAYPTRPYGTVLPFRRIFVVAQRAIKHSPAETTDESLRR